MLIVIMRPIYTGCMYIPFLSPPSESSSDKTFMQMLMHLVREVQNWKRFLCFVIGQTVHDNGRITSFKNGYLLWFNGKLQFAAVDHIFLTVVTRKAFSVLVDWKEGTDDCPLEIIFLNLFHVDDCTFICQPDRCQAIKTFANKWIERHKYNCKLYNVLDKNGSLIIDNELLDCDIQFANYGIKS